MTDSQKIQEVKNRYGIVGDDAILNFAVERALAIAPIDVPVLVTGESGVGKDTIPRIIHDYSIRKKKNGKFLAINCGAIAEGIVDSELFGHEKGAFTGAVETRKGFFEEADGGTIFLDEIGELPLTTQSKLLRVLQSGEYMKVGSAKVSKTDVRIIAATNKDLPFLISKGKFREDLYYRINAINIALPSLRERKADIPLLFRKFAADFTEKNSLRNISLTADAAKMLMSYRWPGNIRQLLNFTEEVTLFESLPKMGADTSRVEIDGTKIAKYMPREESTNLPVLSHETSSSSISDDEKQQIFGAILALKNEVARLRSMVEGTASQQQTASVERMVEAPRVEWQRKDTFDEVDEQEQEVSAETPQPQVDITMRKQNDILIEEALRKFGGNRKEAAKALGISERTIYRFLQKHKD